MSFLHKKAIKEFYAKVGREVKYGLKFPCILEVAKLFEKVNPSVANPISEKHIMRKDVFNILRHNRMIVIVLVLARIEMVCTK